ncbi:MAG TPA: hypothetical protein VH589_27455 [Trebonia sp.]
MSSDSARALAAELAGAVVAVDPVSISRLAAGLAGLSGPGWLRVDEVARRSSWRHTPIDFVADWRPFLATDAPVAGVVAASMCRDGRIREAAVRVLGGLCDPVASAALAVRVADWVPEVAGLARAAVSVRTGPVEAAAIVPVCLALGKRIRGRQPAARYLADVAGGPVGTLQALAVAGDRACRLWALGKLKARGLMPADVLAARAMRDADPAVALWCARALADPSGELPAQEGQPLLGSARAGVRAFAAGHLRSGELPVPALRDLLLDRSAAVRSVARWRWRRQHGDPGAVYRAALAGPGPGRHVAAALAGLDEDHDACLPGAAVPFLGHPSPRVRWAAAQAVARHTDPGVTVQLLVPLLGDPSAKVTAVALRYLRGHALPGSVLADLDAAGSPRSRRIALSIRQQSGSWERVCADLAAMAVTDPDLAEAARTDLLSWLQHGAATSYGGPTAAQAEQITSLLATPRLSQQQRRDIAFVAGIPMTVLSCQDPAGR